MGVVHEGDSSLQRLFRIGGLLVESVLYYVSGQPQHI